jgi:hypothetical protein
LDLGDKTQKEKGVGDPGTGNKAIVNKATSDKDPKIPRQPSQKIDNKVTSKVILGNKFALEDVMHHGNLLWSR